MTLLPLLFVGGRDPWGRDEGDGGGVEDSGGGFRGRKHPGPAGPLVGSGTVLPSVPPSASSSHRRDLFPCRGRRARACGDCRRVVFMFFPLHQTCGSPYAFFKLPFVTAADTSALPTYFLSVAAPMTSAVDRYAWFLYLPDRLSPGPPRPAGRRHRRALPSCLKLTPLLCSSLSLRSSHRRAPLSAGADHRGRLNSAKLKLLTLRRHYDHSDPSSASPCGRKSGQR